MLRRVLAHAGDQRVWMPLSIERQSNSYPVLIAALEIVPGLEFHGYRPPAERTIVGEPNQRRLQHAVPLMLPVLAATASKSKNWQVLPKTSRVSFVGVHRNDASLRSRKRHKRLTGTKASPWLFRPSLLSHDGVPSPSRTPGTVSHVAVRGHPDRSVVSVETDRWPRYGTPLRSRPVTTDSTRPGTRRFLQTISFAFVSSGSSTGAAATTTLVNARTARPHAGRQMSLEGTPDEV